MLTEVAFGCFAWCDFRPRCWSFSLNAVIISCIFHTQPRRAGVVYPTLYWRTKAIMFSLISLPQKLRLTCRNVCAELSSLDVETSNNKYGSKEDMIHYKGWQYWLSSICVCHIFRRTKLVNTVSDSGKQGWMSNLLSQLQQPKLSWLSVLSWCC